MVPLSLASNCLAVSETPNKQNGWSVCQPWFYLRLLAQGQGLTALLGYPREHRVARETRLKPNPSKDTYPRTRVLPQDGNRKLLARNGCLVLRSSCLWVQFAWVEALSFLPHDQRDGSDFARQG
jgi:hypothetical protein